MSRVSGCLWLLVGLILALVAGGVAFVTLQRATVTQAESIPTATLDVVVAARPVPVGYVLQESDLTVQTLPADKVPSSVVKNVAEANGQLTMVGLEAGEMILRHHITKPDISGSNLGFTLPEGKVGVTLSADDLFSRVQILEPGDRVDIYYSLEIPSGQQAGGAVSTSSTQSSNSQGSSTSSSQEGENNQVTFGTLQGATLVNVVRTGLNEQAAQPAAEAGKTPLGTVYAYVLALPPQDALVLKYLKDAGATMDLAVRNITDETQHDAEPVDLPYLIDKYQLQKH